MQSNKRSPIILVFLLSLMITPHVLGQNLSVDLGADLVSSYVWRGMGINSSPNIQPSVTFEIAGLSFGFWGSYSLAKKDKTDDDYLTSSEIDSWISYSQKLDNGMSVSVILTDYYLPYTGKFGNFNNYDDPAGPGAHLIEAGLAISGPESFPVSLSGFMNFHNDAGNNMYFQIDYAASVGDVGLNFFAGASPGSEENPGYYGTDTFNITNLGFQVSKGIVITEKFSIPVSVSFVFNPKADISYFFFMLSL